MYLCCFGMYMVATCVKSYFGMYVVLGKFVNSSCDIKINIKIVQIAVETWW